MKKRILALALALVLALALLPGGVMAANVTAEAAINNYESYYKVMDRYLDGRRSPSMTGRFYCDFNKDGLPEMVCVYGDYSEGGIRVFWSDPAYLDLYQCSGYDNGMASEYIELSTGIFQCDAALVRFNDGTYGFKVGSYHRLEGGSSKVLSMGKRGVFSKTSKKYTVVCDFSMSGAHVGLYDLFAKPTPAAVEVTFLTNGGSAVAPVQAVPGETFALPADPVRPGYVFKGWYANKELTLAWDTSYPAYGGLVLMAAWEPEIVAKANTATVTVDGAPVEFQMYALMDANGGQTNYVKIRDVAYVLRSSSVRFAVGYYSNMIHAVSGWDYEPNGTEMNTPFSGDRVCTDVSGPVEVNGALVEMSAILLTDDQGGGHTYFKLRDLGAALGFKVDWSVEAGYTIDTP